VHRLRQAASARGSAEVHGVRRPGAESDESMAKTNLDRQREYDAANLEAARIVLAQPDAEGLLLEWAWAVVAKHEAKESK
jgi:hypothetical protein